MSAQTFERHERKFLITPEQKELILNNLKDYLVLDERDNNKGIYNVYSLYFDDDFDEIIRNSVNKPIYKEKLRMRSYKLNPTDNDKIFLEIKKKYNGVGNKRRISLSYNECLDYINGNTRPTFNDYLSNQVLKEIDQVLKRREIYPKMFISCKREAFFGKEDKTLRITFDSNITYRNYDVNFSSNEGEILLEDKIVMEVKFGLAFPYELIRMLSEIGLYRRGYSKYGKVFEKTKKLNNTDKRK